MQRTDAEWRADLDDPTRQGAALEALADFLRRTLARGFGRQLADADLTDLTQEALLRVHTKRDTFDGRSRFTTWAAAIAVNFALGELRRRKHREVELTDAVAHGARMVESAEAASQLQRRQRDAVLAEAMRSALTDRQREAMLAKLGGLPMGELAQRLGTSRGALYKLLHDARKRLRAWLEAEGYTLADLQEESG